MIRDSGMRPAVAFIGEADADENRRRTQNRSDDAHRISRQPRAQLRPGGGRFGDSVRRAISSRIWNRWNKKCKSAADVSSPFAPPYGTINVGIIRGGTALNIFAERCVLDWHYRGMPEDDMDAFAAAINSYLQETLLPEMRRGGHPADIVNTKLSSYPGLSPDESPALSLAKSLSGESECEVVSFGTEAGYFQRDGIPAAVIGPGDIAQAHKPDEFVEKTQLSECLHFLDKLRAHLSA